MKSPKRDALLKAIKSGLNTPKALAAVMGDKTPQQVSKSLSVLVNMGLVVRLYGGKYYIKGDQPTEFTQGDTSKSDLIQQIIEAVSGKGGTDNQLMQENQRLKAEVEVLSTELALLKVQLLDKSKKVIHLSGSPGLKSGAKSAFKDLIDTQPKMTLREYSDNLFNQGYINRSGLAFGQPTLTRWRQELKAAL